jgi:uncharacterized protein
MSSTMQRVENVVRQKLLGESTGHDWYHADRVRRTALAIGAREDADLEIVELAALVHDIADPKLNNGDPEVGVHEVIRLLRAEGVAQASIDKVVKIITTMSFKGAGVKTPMATIQGEVVQDADRLDALGAIGIARCFAYGGHHGESVHDPTVSPALHQSAEEYKSAKTTSLNHFHEKLYLLKDRMNTVSARTLAEDRDRYMRAFEERLRVEWEGEK